MTVASTYAVRPSEVLSIVADKVEMVEGMMGWAVDHVLERMIGDHVRVVDEDCPEVDEDEEDEVEVALEREDEDEEVIWDGLGIPIHRVEGMRSERCRNDPLVMRFMESPIEERQMEPSMDPVNAIVGKQQIKWYAEEEVRPAIFVRSIVQFGITPHFTQEPGKGKDSHERKGPKRAHYFLSDLIFQEPWMAHHVVIEDVLVGEGGEEEVEDMNSEEGD